MAMPDNLRKKNGQWNYVKAIPEGLREAVGRALNTYREDGTPYRREIVVPLGVRDLSLAGRREAFRLSISSGAAERAEKTIADLYTKRSMTAIISLAYSGLKPERHILPALKRFAELGTFEPPRAHVGPTLASQTETFIEREVVDQRTTRTAYRSALNKLIQVIGDQPVRAVSAEDGRTFKKFLLDQGNGNDSVKKDFIRVRRYLSWFVEEGVIDINPFRDIQIKLEPDSEPGLPFENTEVLKTLTSLERFSDDWWWWAVAVHSGMRPKEQSQMSAGLIVEFNDRPHFNLDPNKIDLKGDEKSARYLPIAPWLIRHGLLEYAGKKELLFKPWEHYSFKFNRHILPDLGLKTDRKYLRCTRQTFSVGLELIRPQVPEITIERLLGHWKKTTRGKSYSRNMLHPDESNVIDRLSFGLPDMLGRRVQ